jgi:galactose-1-phosphate uridylyltransferase
MKKIKINGLTFKIIDKESYEDEKLTVDDIWCAGTTHYYDQEIYMWNGLTKEKWNQTLIHELTHAYMFALGLNKGPNGTILYNEDDICNIMELHSQNILAIAKPLMR